MQFDMNTTWSRAIALVGSNLQLLAVIAGVFLLIPGVAIYLANPDLANMLVPTSDPEQMAAQLENIAPSIFLWGFISFLLQMVGYMAMIALMGSHRPTVGEAIMAAIKSLPSVIGATILFFIAYMIVLFIAIMAISLVTALVGLPAVGVILFFLLIPFIFYFLLRFVLVLPIIVLEGVYNPVTALTRSWRLTGPKIWSIVGFWLLLIVAYIVISLLLLGVFSMFGALAASSTGSLLILGLFNGVFGAIIAMIFSGIFVAMHEQLAGESAERLSETFD